VRRADRLLIAPPPPFLHNEKEGLDLRERKVDLVLERGQREWFYGVFGYEKKMRKKFRK
jgi:hypothetical protein